MPNNFQSPIRWAGSQCVLLGSWYRRGVMLLKGSRSYSWKCTQRWRNPCQILILERGNVQEYSPICFSCPSNRFSSVLMSVFLFQFNFFRFFVYFFHFDMIAMASFICRVLLYLFSLLLCLILVIFITIIIFTISSSVNFLKLYLFSSLCSHYDYHHHYYLYSSSVNFLSVIVFSSPRSPSHYHYHRHHHHNKHYHYYNLAHNLKHQP